MKLIASNQLTLTNILERAELRRETFYKLTNSADVPSVDNSWSTDTLVPTQQQRYLWKFDYIYYSDGSVEITSPAIISIDGIDGIIGKDGQPVGGDSVQVSEGLTLTITDGNTAPIIKKYK